jgi:DNA-binding transcriptional ArsR family regulator
MTQPQTAASKAIGDAADLLKLMANANRLAILCRLSEGEASVSEMEETLGIRQPTHGRACSSSICI